MNCIIVFRGLTDLEFKESCHRLKSQFEEREMVPPFFAQLPLLPDERQIEVVWIDPKMELENLTNILKHTAGESTNESQ